MSTPLIWALDAAARRPTLRLERTMHWPMHLHMNCPRDRRSLAWSRPVVQIAESLTVVRHSAAQYTAKWFVRTPWTPSAVYAEYANLFFDLSPVTVDLRDTCLTASVFTWHVQ